MDNDKKEIELNSYPPVSSSDSLVASSSSSLSSSPSTSVTSSFSELPHSETFAHFSGPSTEIFNYIEDLTGITDECEACILEQLASIKVLMSSESESLDSFKVYFQEIANALNKLRGIEFDSRAKERIQYYISSFYPGLKNYIYAYLDGNYEIAKVLIKLQLKIMDRLLSQKQELYLVYELENILNLFERIKGETIKIDGDNYLFRIHFEEIDALLKEFEVDKLEDNHKILFSNLVERILLQAQYEEFYSDPYNLEVLKKLSSLLVISKKKENIENCSGVNEKKDIKETAGRPRSSSYGLILGDFPSGSDKDQRKQVLSIIDALGQIKYLIPDCNQISENKINNDSLRKQFEVIKASLKNLEKLDLSGFENYIEGLIMELRVIIDQRKFEFYNKDNEMAEIFFNLECKCKSQENSIGTPEDNKTKSNKNTNLLPKSSAPGAPDRDTDEDSAPGVNSCTIC